MKTVQDVYEMEKCLREFIEKRLNIHRSHRIKCYVEINNINRESNTCKCHVEFYFISPLDYSSGSVNPFYKQLLFILTKAGVEILSKNYNDFYFKLPVKESDIENLFTVFKIQDNFQ